MLSADSRTLHRYVSHDFRGSGIKDERRGGSPKEPNTSLMDMTWYGICRNRAAKQNYNGKGSLFIQQDQFVRAVS